MSCSELGAIGYTYCKPYEVQNLRIVVFSSVSKIRACTDKVLHKDHVSVFLHHKPVRIVCGVLFTEYCFCCFHYRNELASVAVCSICCAAKRCTINLHSSEAKNFSDHSMYVLAYASRRNAAVSESCLKLCLAAAGHSDG